MRLALLKRASYKRFPLTLTRNLYEAYRGLYARNLTRQAYSLPFFMGDNMENLKIYEIENSYADKILKNAKSLYEYKMKNGNSTPLAKRCNDFTLLEEKCKKYLSSYKDGKLVMRGSLDKRGWLGRSQTWESISQAEVEKLIAEANATYDIK